MLNQNQYTTYVPNVSIDLQDRAIEEAEYGRYPYTLRCNRIVFFGVCMMTQELGQTTDVLRKWAAAHTQAVQS